MTTLLSTCSCSAPLGPTVDVYRGHAVFGHEVRSFRPCGSVDTLWAIDPTGLLTILHGELTGDSEPYEGIFAVVEGSDRPAPVDGFGADYPGALSVDAVLYAGLEGSGCDTDWNTFRYRARGNEPFWMIDVAAAGMRLSRPGETDVRWAEATREDTATGIRFTGSGSPGMPPLELVVTRQDCRDSMSGAYFAFTAAARFGDLELNGCTLVGSR